MKSKEKKLKLKANQLKKLNNILYEHMNILPFLLQSSIEKKELSQQHKEVLTKSTLTLLDLCKKRYATQDVIVVKNLLHSLNGEEHECLEPMFTIQCDDTIIPMYSDDNGGYTSGELSDVPVPDSLTINLG